LKVHDFNSIHTTLFRNPVVSIGIYDGVHKGHHKIIETLKRRAIEHQGESVVVTLWPHPREILYPEKPIRYLSTLEEKRHLLTKTGIDHFVVIPFTHQLSELTADEFINQILVNRIGVKHLVVGFDNHIGHNRQGGYDAIKSSADKYGFTAEHLDALLFGTERISSSTIRNALDLGEVEKAANYLGYNYFIEGKVVEGRKVGRQIGFPTANIEPGVHKMIPGLGVYAVWAFFDGKTVPGMLNIGYRPTFDPEMKTQTVEVHLIDFEGDLYNKEISVTFVSRIRSEIKFNGVDQLISQLFVDKADTKKRLNIK
jgi:riboflavin kinase/FMN adenylyltransferase